MYNFGRKAIIWFVFVFGFLLSFGFAKDDCDSVFIDISSFSGFMELEDLEIAREHLRAYCCIEKPNLLYLSWKCQNLQAWAESPYWYDHLIDVWFRRLDSESMYPWMTIDEQSSWWRNFLKNTEELKNIEIFKKEYEKYWGQSAPYLFVKYGDNRSNFPKKDIENMSFTLYDKYINYCYISMMIYYQWFGLNNIDIVTDWYYGRCLSMAKSRIRQETSLAIMASQYNAANLLNEWLSSYTNQFLQNRLMKLFDKFVAISSLFNTLAKQAPLSDICTK